MTSLMLNPFFLHTDGTNIGGNMWKFVLDYLQKRRKGGSDSKPDIEARVRTRLIVCYNRFYFILVYYTILEKRISCKFDSF